METEPRDDPGRSVAPVKPLGAVVLILTHQNSRSRHKVENSNMMDPSKTQISDPAELRLFDLFIHGGRESAADCRSARINTETTNKHKVNGMIRAGLWMLI